MSFSFVVLSSCLWVLFHCTHVLKFSYHSTCVWFLRYVFFPSRMMVFLPSFRPPFLLRSFLFPWYNKFTVVQTLFSLILLEFNVESSIQIYYLIWYNVCEFFFAPFLSLFFSLFSSEFQFEGMGILLHLLFYCLRLW